MKQISIPDSFRETGELAIRIPPCPRLALAGIQAMDEGDLHWVDTIEIDKSPTDAVTLNLATVLRAGEEEIKDYEYKRRIVHRLYGGVLHGPQQAIWLAEHRDEPGLAPLKALLGHIYMYIVFSGVVVVGHAHRDRYAFVLSKTYGRWRAGPLWLRSGFDWVGRIAFSGDRQPSAA